MKNPDWLCKATFLYGIKVFVPVLLPLKIVIRERYMCENYNRLLLIFCVVLRIINYIMCGFLALC